MKLKKNIVRKLVDSVNNRDASSDPNELVRINEFIINLIMNSERPGVMIDILLGDYKAPRLPKTHTDDDGDVWNIIEHNPFRAEYKEVIMSKERKAKLYVRFDIIMKNKDDDEVGLTKSELENIISNEKITIYDMYKFDHIVEFDEYAVHIHTNGKHEYYIAAGKLETINNSTSLEQLNKYYYDTN